MHSSKLRQKPKIDIHVLSVRINALTTCCTESTRGRHCARTSWSRPQSDVELQSSCLRLHVIRSALPTGIWYVHALHTLTNAARSLTLLTFAPSATASTREHSRLLVYHPWCYRWVGHVSSMYTHTHTQDLLLLLLQVPLLSSSYRLSANQWDGSRPSEFLPLFLVSCA